MMNNNYAALVLLKELETLERTLKKSQKALKNNEISIKTADTHLKNLGPKIDDLKRAINSDITK